jgi:arsenite methyltransferase
MAITCPVDLDTRRLRDEIQSIYARVADDPSGAFHFHRGPDYAVDLLRYDREALSALPDQSTASFAGVANPHRLGPIGEGLVVADIGCGAGMDLLLAAKAVGPRGRAIGVVPRPAPPALRTSRYASETPCRSRWPTRAWTWSSRTES